MLRPWSLPILVLFAGLACKPPQAPLAGGERAEEAHSVNLPRLRDQILGADRIEVVEGLFPGANRMFTSTDPRDREELASAIQVEVPERNNHCMCEGYPIIQLYRKGKLQVQISNHHGLLLRTSDWISDAPITDQDRWLRWFDTRGMPGPRREVRAMEKQEAEAQAARRRFEAAMPPCLQPLWGKMSPGAWTDPSALKPLQDAMKEAHPDPGSRILALLSWFGSGMGPWSGAPAYEYVPERLLMDDASTALLAAADLRDLSPAEMEGLARAFAGAMFDRRRFRDLHLLPPALKERLLAHVLSTGVPFNMDRARQAFSR